MLLKSAANIYLDRTLICWEAHLEVPADWDDKSKSGASSLIVSKLPVSLIGEYTFFDARSESDLCLPKLWGDFWVGGRNYLLSSSQSDPEGILHWSSKLSVSWLLLGSWMLFFLVDGYFIMKKSSSSWICLVLETFVDPNRYCANSMVYAALNSSRFYPLEFSDSLVKNDKIESAVRKTKNTYEDSDYALMLIKPF